jgi:hypothetical protein
MYLHDTSLSLSYVPATYRYLMSAYVYRIIMIKAHIDKLVVTM